MTTTRKRKQSQDDPAADALHGEDMSEWISVKDSLPDESTLDKQNFVLTWFRGTGWKDHDPWQVEIGEISSGHWRPRGGNGNFDDRVTHWMPLPEPPHREG